MRSECGARAPRMGEDTGGGAEDATMRLPAFRFLLLSGLL
jgi:hypothetical protein